MRTPAVLLATIAAFAVFAAAPAAEARHQGSKGYAKKVRYGGAPGRGYWRPGPAQGYGFGFSTYRGDPFGRDDYYDGDRCYYLHRRDFCVRYKSFTGFR